MEEDKLEKSEFMFWRGDPVQLDAELVRIHKALKPYREDMDFSRGAQLVSTHVAELLAKYKARINQLETEVTRPNVVSWLKEIFSSARSL